MSDNDTFKMTYSSEERNEIEEIRSRYEDRKKDGMARLRALDAESETKAKIVSLSVGIIGTLVFGTGLSLYLSDFGLFLGEKVLLVSILVGIAGIIMIIIAYPLYNYTLKRERAKRKEEILSLANELMKRT